MEQSLTHTTFKYYKDGSYLIRVEDKPDGNLVYRGIDNRGMPILIDGDGLRRFNEVTERTFYNYARF